MKLQTVDTTGKPEDIPAMVLCEVWDGDKKPEDCERAYVAWSGGTVYPFRTSGGKCFKHAVPIPAPEPKPRSLVWWWLETYTEDSLCDYIIHSDLISEFNHEFSTIPARYENGELEPTPTVAEAKWRKEAGE